MRNFKCASESRSLILQWVDFQFWFPPPRSPVERYMFPSDGCFCVFALIGSTMIHMQALRRGACHFETVRHTATACKSVRLIPKMLLFCQISYSAGKHKPDEQHKLHSWGNSFFRLIFWTITWRSPFSSSHSASKESFSGGRCLGNRFSSFYFWSFQLIFGLLNEHLDSLPWQRRSLSKSTHLASFSVFDYCNFNWRRSPS